MTKKIGLLPLYLKLYDDTCPHMRPRVEGFAATIAGSLTDKGFEVISAPVCRLKAEFADAVKLFEDSGVCAIVTLHLAYSPSLECADALSATELPLIVLDTTATYAFSPDTDADEIMYNHGIHGVQDMCNLLKRKGKAFEVFAGHYEKSGVIDRVAAACEAAAMVDGMKRARVGIVGEPFDGMGDFRVPFESLKADLGVETVPYDFERGAGLIAEITGEEIDAEMEADRERFDFDKSVSRQLYEKSARVELAVRRWIEEQRLTAFTINFLATEGSNPGLPVMPFTECSKELAAGIGYAGEGDVLTASLVGAVLQVYEKATFSEMFCPDWMGGSVFLSHMGEFNLRAAAGKPTLTEKDFPYTDADNPTVAYATYGPGDALMVNLAPGPGGKYTLIVAPGRVMEAEVQDSMKDSVNGWFKPERELAEFLESYSLAGGTHHLVLVYGGKIDVFTAFAGFMGFECIVI